jgi:hypothetical protein
MKGAAKITHPDAVVAQRTPCPIEAVGMFTGNPIE